MTGMPLGSLVRWARLSRLAAALALLGGVAALVLALSGHGGRAVVALQIALFLGGLALLGTLGLLIYARRIRRQQEP